MTIDMCSAKMPFHRPVRLDRTITFAVFVVAASGKVPDEAQLAWRQEAGQPLA